MANSLNSPKLIKPPVNPFDREENLQSWFEKDSDYQKSYISSFHTSFPKLSISKPMTTINSPLHSLRFWATQHVALSIIFAILALASVSVVAAELIAPESQKPSTIIENIISPEVTKEEIPTIQPEPQIKSEPKKEPQTQIITQPVIKPVIQTLYSEAEPIAPNSTLDVFSEPCGTIKTAIIGRGTTGVITNTSPTEKNCSGSPTQWYEVKWDNNLTGWSTINNLKVSETKPKFRYVSDPDVVNFKIALLDGWNFKETRDLKTTIGNQEYKYRKVSIIEKNGTLMYFDAQHISPTGFSGPLPCYATPLSGAVDSKIIRLEKTDYFDDSWFQDGTINLAKTNYILYAARNELVTLKGEPSFPSPNQFNFIDESLPWPEYSIESPEGVTPKPTYEDLKICGFFFAGFNSKLSFPNPDKNSQSDPNEIRYDGWFDIFVTGNLNNQIITETDQIVQNSTGFLETL